LIVAEVVAAHGLKGAVKIRPLTDFPEHLAELKAVMLETDEGEIGVRRIEWIKHAGGRMLVKIEGIEDRTAAEALRGARLKIRQADAAPLPPGHYRVLDIVGMRAVTTAGDDLGEITEVIRTPANDVYVTPRAMIPAVKEIVREISLERRMMIVEPIPGLIEDQAGIDGPRED
jgi:16S rRNA processing protein RimM